MHTRRRLIKNLFILIAAIPLAPALAKASPSLYSWQKAVTRGIYYSTATGRWPRRNGKSYFMSKQLMYMQRYGMGERRMREILINIDYAKVEEKVLAHIQAVKFKDPPID